MLLENGVLVFGIVLKVVVIMQMNNWQLIFFFLFVCYWHIPTRGTN